MISLQHISAGYRKHPVLEDLSLEIGSGKLVALMGRNGSGKSTLLRAIASQDTLTDGKIFIGGQEISKMKNGEKARLIATVGTEKTRITNLRCGELVALGRAPYTDWIGNLSAEDRTAVQDALDAVGMGSFAGRTMDSLSDGECQKIMIARALAQDTPVLLLDEPTAWLDIPGRYQVAALLQRLAHERNRTIIYSTHDLEVARRHADLVVIVNNTEEGETRLVTGTPEHLERQGIFSAIFQIGNL